MDKLKQFLAKRIQYEPETKDQKAVIRELAEVQQHVDTIGNVEDDSKNEQQYDAFVECADEQHDTNSDADAKSSAPSIEVEKKEEPVDPRFQPKVVHMGGKEVIYITFDKNDPEDPYNWSKGHKAFCVFIMMFLTFIGGVAGASLSAGVSSMQEELHTNAELARFGYTIFIFGFAVGPLITSPLAEDYGRWPCYMAGIFGILIFHVPVGAGHHIAVIIVFRFLGGFVGSVASSMISGTIADIYLPNDRGYPMLWHTAINFLGNVASPVAFGYVGWLMSFRWIAWILIMASGLTMLLMFLFMEETRGLVILQTRANRLQKKYGGPNKVYLVHGKAYIPMHKKLARTLTRPIIFLFTEPVVGFFSLWMGFTWGMIYINFGLVPAVMENVYGMNVGLANMTEVAEIVGIIIGCGLDILQQHLYQRGKAKRGPEARLYTSCLAGILCFAGILIFGLTQNYGWNGNANGDTGVRPWSSYDGVRRGNVHWMGPICGLAILLVGVVTIFQAISLYFADCYGTYASSALAAQSLLRNICGFAFPLFTNQMFEGMGYLWASILAALVCAVLALVPFWLVIWGKKLRDSSKYTVSDEELT